jgi:two-component system sensor histidine kinase FlrB
MIPAEKEKIELLHEAFHRFSSVSLDLERSYKSMEAQVQQLKLELEKSSAENDLLREKAERNLRLAAAGEMAARMAHELRNPLGSIELFAGLLKKNLMDDPVKQQWAIHISSAVSAMDYALTNLLLFTGKPLPSFKSQDLTEIIDEARIFSLPLLIQNRIEVMVRMEKITKPVQCDDSLLKQVFLNLIINAVDAMPDGGTLTLDGELCTFERGEMIKITISDTGGGIPEEVQSRIFDPFFTTKNKGTGLGLSIVHNAIQAHGGMIEVDSSREKGTTFTIILPIQSGDSQ